jgi:hypothetical protein
MARTTNYDNRRVSLSIYDSGFNYRSDMEQAAPTTLNGKDGGFVCAGIVKLCQSVLVFLLSDDVVFDSEWGSAIPRYMNASVQSLSTDIENIMEAAFAETIRQLRFNEKPNAPADERIQGLVLRNWDFVEEGSGITVSIRVTSVAGETRDLVVPLNLTV